MTEMSKLIDTINAQYVSKDEFNTLVKDVNDFKDLIAKELKARSKKPPVSKFKSKSSGKIATEAKEFFNKKYYTKAIESYEYLIKKNYKPAYAHYMIGEMNFRRKNYSNAISYFKKSSALYAKASYMPKLMLHTAISMDKTGDKAHAKAFFKAVIAKYPNSAEADTAKEYIQQ
jgi:TolA-binding protein